jgi:hypothetical protein
MEGPYEARLGSSVSPPVVHGLAPLAGLAFRGADLARLLAHVERPAPDAEARAALDYDRSVALQLAFRRDEGLALQGVALAGSRLFRISGCDAEPARLRVLALMAPGDLMVNTPIEFLIDPEAMQLDLLYLPPGQELPEAISDHDVAFMAVSESDLPTLARLEALCAVWPRPVVNDPARIPMLARDRLWRVLAGCEAICCPPTVRLSRAYLRAGELPPGWAFPVLARPAGSHGGAGLAKAADARALAACVEAMEAAEVFLTPFIDYRGPDGLFRKYRIALVGGAPFLCHMAVSEHWMVHYLNAGMTESAAKRAEEAQAMRSFDTGFAHRHAAALAVFAERIGLDYVALDCAETPERRLLLFEADVAAIVHAMDPPELFPYKSAQMRRVFAAFRNLLAARSQPCSSSSSAIGQCPAAFAPADRQSRKEGPCGDAGYAVGL